MNFHHEPVKARSEDKSRDKIFENRLKRKREKRNVPKIKKSYSRKYTNRICFDYVAELRRKQYTEKKDLKNSPLLCPHCI